MKFEYGQVRFFKTDRGFGFVAPVQGGRDLFFHSRMILGKVPTKGDVAKHLESPRLQSWLILTAAQYRLN